MEPQTHTDNARPAAVLQSNAQILWHLVVLYSATGGLYMFPWCYRNWKQFKQEKGLALDHKKELAKLFIPIYSYVILYRQFRDMKQWIAEKNIAFKQSPGELLCYYVGFNLLWRLPDPFWMLSLLSVLPFVFVQNALNDYWHAVHPDRPLRTTLSGRQIAAVVTGGIVWLLAIAGFFIRES